MATHITHKTTTNPVDGTTLQRLTFIQQRAYAYTHSIEEASKFETFEQVDALKYGAPSQDALKFKTHTQCSALKLGASVEEAIKCTDFKCEDHYKKQFISRTFGQALVKSPLMNKGAHSLLSLKEQIELKGQDVALKEYVEDQFQICMESCHRPKEKLSGWVPCEYCHNSIKELAGALGVEAPKEKECA